MDLVFSGTIELAAEIRAGQVSATEVLEAHLAQIEQRNPALKRDRHHGRRRRPCTGA
jgi:amidase